MKAITAAVVLAAAFATGIAHTLQAPKVRATSNGARRLDWEEHMDDLENRKAFLRYYRMPEETFDKQVQLLAPHLENECVGATYPKKGVSFCADWRERTYRREDRRRENGG